MRLLLIFIVGIQLQQPWGWSEQSAPSKESATVKVTVQGDSALLADFIENLQKEFQRQGVKLELVQQGNPMDYIIIVAQESAFDGASAAAIALDPNCKLIASVVRGGRISAKGALKASAKELARKVFVLAKIR